jgi:hypothetical protein
MILALGAHADEFRGMIMARAGDTMIVNTGSGRLTVVLNANTRTKDDKGLEGLTFRRFAFRKIRSSIRSPSNSRFGLPS